MEFVDEDEEPNPELNRITNAIIGAAIAVHSKLGPGYLESFYANALAIEFAKRDIAFEKEHRFEVLYDGQVIGVGSVDFLVEGKVIVELKAVDTLSPLFTAQVISYLKANNIKLGILLNFNCKVLKDGIRRIAK